MPKSKNRRKPKRQAASGAATASTAVSTDTAPAADASAAPAPKAKKKVGTVQFFRQVREEGQKVTWTSRNETMISTIMVLIMVAIASVFFLLVDQVLYWIVPRILNLPLAF